LAKKITIAVRSDKYKPETVRYAAYAVSGEAYVFLEPGKKGEVLVSLEPKQGAGAGLKARFLSELKDEKLRSGIAQENAELRDFLVHKGLSAPAARPPEGGSVLTSEQEKELDDLIAQVEREIKTEGKSFKDPFGIGKTWEDKYGSKTTGKKKK